MWETTLVVWKVPWKTGRAAGIEDGNFGTVRGQGNRCTVRRLRKRRQSVGYGPTSTRFHLGIGSSRRPLMAQDRFEMAREATRVGSELRPCLQVRFPKILVRRRQREVGVLDVRAACWLRMCVA